MRVTAVAAHDLCLASLISDCFHVTAATAATTTWRYRVDRYAVGRMNGSRIANDCLKYGLVDKLVANIAHARDHVGSGQSKWK